MPSKKLPYQRAWVRSGVAVWYHPVIDEDDRYAAVVDGEPWLWKLWK